LMFIERSVGPSEGPLYKSKKGFGTHPYLHL
jgi:hypothetical protein